MSAVVIDTASNCRPWRAVDLAADTSWTMHLTAEEVAGFEVALEHAKRSGKALLDLTAEDFPLTEAARSLLDRAMAKTQKDFGVSLVKGFPVHRWSEADSRLAYWGMGLHMGLARPQNRSSEVIADVRDEGGGYPIKNIRGYTTNARLDFHMDSCDVVGLLCRRTAKSGGTSMILSSIALRDEVVKRRPDLLATLQQPFLHSYQNSQDPTQPPYYRCSIISNDPSIFALRTNRKNTQAVEIDFEDAPRLSSRQIEALDLLDQIMLEPGFAYSMPLEMGDMQLLNNYVTLHSRTQYEDHQDPDQKRHLLRLWLAVPYSQPLPQDWEEYYGDVRAGVVRGGLRGSAITPQFLAFEKRQAESLGMPLRPWRPLVRREANS